MKILNVFLAMSAALLAAPATAQTSEVVAYGEVPARAYSVVAQVRAKPGKEQALRAATIPLIANVRSDPKNLVYFLQEDRARPGHFIFYEVFESEADFEAHNAMPYVQEWFRKLPDLAHGDVEVLRMEVFSGVE